LRSGILRSPLEQLRISPPSVQVNHLRILIQTPHPGLVDINSIQIRTKWQNVTQFVARSNNTCIKLTGGVEIKSWSVELRLSARSLQIWPPEWAAKLQLATMPNTPGASGAHLIQTRPATVATICRQRSSGAHRVQKCATCPDGEQNFQSARGNRQRASLAIPTACVWRGVCTPVWRHGGGGGWGGAGGWAPGGRLRTAIGKIEQKGLPVFFGICTQPRGYQRGGRGPTARLDHEQVWKGVGLTGSLYISRQLLELRILVGLGWGGGEALYA